MIRLAAFDAYGTLFDVSSAARRVAAEPGGAALAAAWPELARDWRRKQLEYTWIRAVTGAHADFAQVTADGLDWALEAAGVAEAGLRARLIALYHELDAYPEVPETLRRLRAAGIGTAILSNGTPAMLDAAVARAGIGDLLDDVLSVESAGVFKPARAVYDLVGARFGTTPGAVLFVSANGWDAAAGAGYGFVTAWVNRESAPRDRLPWSPAHEVSDLAQVPELVGG